MSKQTKTGVCLIAGMMLLIIGCSKSSEDTLVTPTPNQCDTTNMTYSTDVQPILQANCYGCHGNGAASAGVSLDNYTGVKTVADDGRLIGVITHAQGFPPMPKGGAKLSDCDINKIKAWVNSGASNN